MKLHSLNTKTILSILSAIFIGISFLANTVNASAEATKLESIIVAGGCFWCTESDFEKHPGVVEAVSGYINGTTKNPTYREVSTNRTGHYEAVKITFDATKTDIAELTEYYWATVDPTDPKGQFCDKGSRGI